MHDIAAACARGQATHVIGHFVRRGRTLDVVEDVLPLYDVRVQVRAGQQPSAVRLVPEAQDVAWQWRDGYADIAIPRVNGYQIVQLVGAA